MADACCGGNSKAPLDACCGSPAPVDACCGGSSGGDGEARWRTPAVLAAVAWLAGIVVDLAGGADVAATTLFVVAIVAGGGVVVPGALRGVVRGRLGVALLMTVALVAAPPKLPAWLRRYVITQMVSMWRRRPFVR